MAGERSLLTLLASAYLLISATLMPASGYEVGVKAGDWAKYGEVSSSWSTSLQNRTEPPNLLELRTTDWIRFEVLDIFETIVQGLLTFHNKNGTDRTSTGMGDVMMGELGIYIIPAGLSKGNTFNLSLSPFTILESFSRSCGGEDRDVNYLRINSTDPLMLDNINLTEVNTLDLYWDRATGIMCEFSTYSTLNNLENKTVEDALMSMKMTETNLWGPGRIESTTTTTSTISTPETTARDLTPNLLVGIAVVAVLVGVFIYSRVKRRPEEG